MNIKPTKRSQQRSILATEDHKDYQEMKVKGNKRTSNQRIIIRQFNINKNVHYKMTIIWCQKVVEV